MDALPGLFAAHKIRQLLLQQPQSAAAMTDKILFARIHLRKGFAPDQKNRVVAKAIFPMRLKINASLAFPTQGQTSSIRKHAANRADKPGGTFLLGHILQIVKQMLGALAIIPAGKAVSRRVDARLAVERIHA